MITWFGIVQGSEDQEAEVQAVMFRVSLAKSVYLPGQRFLHLKEKIFRRNVPVSEKIVLF